MGRGDPALRFFCRPSRRRGPFDSTPPTTHTPTCARKGLIGQALVSRVLARPAENTPAQRGGNDRNGRRGYRQRSRGLTRKPRQHWRCGQEKGQPRSVGLGVLVEVGGIEPPSGTLPVCRNYDHKLIMGKTLCFLKCYLSIFSNKTRTIYGHNRMHLTGIKPVSSIGETQREDHHAGG